MDYQGIFLMHGVGMELAELWAERFDRECTEGGLLVPMPASYYRAQDQMKLAVWCVLRGYYQLPTVELVAWLKEYIGDRRAIEIGSGNGVLARALGIVGTDSHQQEEADRIAHYKKIQQAVIEYGSDVEKIDALSAIKKHRPEVVLAAWVTHCYQPDRPAEGGNVDGVDEWKVVKRTGEYVFVGNMGVHRDKPLFRRAYASYDLPFLFSRSMMAERNRVWCWRGDKSRPRP